MAKKALCIGINDYPGTDVTPAGIAGVQDAGQHLLYTLLQADEPESARSLFAQHLAWLTLGANQCRIREWLVAHYGLDSPNGAE